MLHELPVFVRNMFFDKRSSLEELLTRLTAELTLVLLLDEGLYSFRQLPVQAGLRYSRRYR